MEIGKIPNDILNDRIISIFKKKRHDVIAGPGIGQDCGIIDFGDEVCVVSTDPITGTANNIGYLGIHISCNDIATTGAETIGVTLTLLAPPTASMEDIERVMKDANRAVEEIGVDVIGGHTEVTTAVERMVFSITAIGRMRKDRLVDPRAAQIGDSIILTKKAGLEGTAILAHDKADELALKFDNAFIHRAQTFIKQISVVKEGRIAGIFGAHGMHDVTEGGVLGALWEMAQAAGKGIKIWEDRIPIATETREICKYFDINPLALISSGSMVIICPDGQGLLYELEKEGIEATIIGEVTGEETSWRVTQKGQQLLTPPVADELYKVLK